jgi:hypothetical protein
MAVEVDGEQQGTATSPEVYRHGPVHRWDIIVLQEIELFRFECLDGDFLFKV